jgi:hypothetical protein
MRLYISGRLKTAVQDRFPIRHRKECMFHSDIMSCLMRKVGSIPVNFSHFLVSPLIRTRSLCTHACTYIGGTIMTRVLPDALFL